MISKVFVFHTPEGDGQMKALQHALATAVHNLLLAQVIATVAVPDGQEHGRVDITVTDAGGKTLSVSVIPRNCGLKLCTEREEIMHTGRDVWQIRPEAEAAP